jgi:hypothetical protein
MYDHYIKKSTHKTSQQPEPETELVPEARKIKRHVSSKDISGKGNGTTSSANKTDQEQDHSILFNVGMWTY